MLRFLLSVTLHRTWTRSLLYCTWWRIGGFDIGSFSRALEERYPGLVHESRHRLQSWMLTDSMSYWAWIRQGQFLLPYSCQCHLHIAGGGDALWMSFTICLSNRSHAQQPTLTLALIPRCSVAQIWEAFFFFFNLRHKSSKQSLQSTLYPHVKAITWEEKNLSRGKYLTSTSQGLTLPGFREDHLS